MGVMTVVRQYQQAINLVATSGVPTYTFLAAPPYVDSPGTNSATFFGVNLGTVGPNNYTVVVIVMTNAGPLTSITIGGVTATGNGSDTNIYWALTPSSTGTITVNNTGTITTVGILVAQITNVTTLGTPFSVTTYGAKSGTWNVGSGVTIPVNGIGVVGGFLASNTGTNPGVTGFSVDHVTVDAGSSTEMFIGNTTTTGSITPTVTFTGNGDAQIAVFSP
jgi:hypothetical protein